MKSQILTVAMLLGGVCAPQIGFSQEQKALPIVETKTFELIKLPYATDALAPVISKQTIELHHGKHLKAYVDQVNKLKGTKFANATIEEIVRNSSGSLFNNAGQLLNHNLYFTQFSPNPKASEPIGKVSKLIQKQWGSFAQFQKEFEDTGSKLFGSGWLWLSANPQGELEISLHPGGESPILKGNKLLLGIDLWEHAYYLDYYNKRSDHLKALWPIIDWSIVEDRLK